MVTLGRLAVKLAADCGQTRASHWPTLFAMTNTQSCTPRRPGHWQVAALAAAVGIAAGLLAGGWQRQRKVSGVPSAEALLAAMRERMARQGQAARQLDHDLRAPVGAMAVALELMGTADDAALRQEAVQVLGRQVARMNTLTQRLHEIARDFNE